jgi:hypothetical protein
MSQFNIPLHNNSELEAGLGTENFFELQPVASQLYFPTGNLNSILYYS